MIYKLALSYPILSLHPSPPPVPRVQSIYVKGRIGFFSLDILFFFLKGKSNKLDRGLKLASVYDCRRIRVFGRRLK